MKKQTIVLPLSALTFSGKIQARSTIDRTALEDYVRDAKEAKDKGADSPFPSIKAAKRGDQYLVYSGFTRGNALKKVGYEETKVDVIDGEKLSDDDLFMLAMDENARHGARTTNEDRRHNLARIVKMEKYKDYSNNALVPLVGASEFFIRQHRPAASGGTKRTAVSRTGKKTEIKTGNIGKKSGKKGKSVVEDATNDENKALDEALNGAAPTPPSSSNIDDETNKALTKICSVVTDHKSGQFRGDELRKAIENGTLKISAKEIREWAATSDARIKQVAPLVINRRIPVARAFKIIDDPVTSDTKVAKLLNLAVVGGGYVVGQDGEPGEPIEDDKDSRVLAFNSKRFKVTITAIK